MSFITDRNKSERSRQNLYDFRNPEDLEEFELERTERAVSLRVLLYHTGRLKLSIRRGFATASRLRRYQCYKALLSANSLIDDTGQVCETIK